METIGRLALAAAALCLSGCAGESVDFNLSRSSSANAVQPYPVNYRSELPAFMKTYLNDPRGIREAGLADPVQRTIVGRQLYIACLRYNARDPGGGYPGTKERAVVFVDGRLDRLIEKGDEFCSGATYQPFPELEKLQR